MPDLKITGESDLRAAIQKLARAAGCDDIRKDVIAAARELDLRGLLPDNWATDGTLRSTDGTWDLEQRETYNDLYTALSDALDDLFGRDGDDYFYGCYVWVQDFTTTDVIFSVSGDLYSAPYTVTEGGPVTIGDRVKVRPVTEYVETSTERAATPLLEWRRKKATEIRGKGLERRTFHVSDMELRADDDGLLHLTGYASVTETPYDVGFYEETIARGAFTRTLSEEPDVQLLVNHTGLPLARTKSGTLKLEERERGLWVDASLDPEDPDVQSLARKMKRGDIDQMSFAFQATDSDWSDDFTRRRIKTVSIHRGDVSVVNMGANPSSTATIRSQDAILALRSLGADAFVAAWAEWRDHTLLPIEERAGKALSASTMEVLSQVLNLVTAADDALDEAQPMLATLMGVPTPDDEAEETAETEVVERSAISPVPVSTTSHRQRLAALQAGRR